MGVAIGLVGGGVYRCVGVTGERCSVGACIGDSLGRKVGGTRCQWSRIGGEVGVSRG